MISNDERREVAARLRDYESLREAFMKSPLCAFLDALGVEGYIDWNGVINILADLIEPEQERICRNVSENPDDFYCSECTAFIRGTMVDDLYFCHPIGKVISHCPNCQSKVMR